MLTGLTAVVHQSGSNIATSISINSSAWACSMLCSFNLEVFTAVVLCLCCFRQQTTVCYCRKGREKICRNVIWLAMGLHSLVR